MKRWVILLLHYHLDMKKKEEAVIFRVTSISKDNLSMMLFNWRDKCTRLFGSKKTCVSAMNTISRHIFYICIIILIKIKVIDKLLCAKFFFLTRINLLFMVHQWLFASATAELKHACNIVVPSKLTPLGLLYLIPTWIPHTQIQRSADSTIL